MHVTRDCPKKNDVLSCAWLFVTIVYIVIVCQESHSQPDLSYHVHYMQMTIKVPTDETPNTVAK